MASGAGEEFRRPVTLALSGIAIIGWLVSAYMWQEEARAESEMADSLHLSEKAREALAADLQNLQKAAGTAAEIKVQATETQKALSDVSAARASAQNELADLTRQINDARFAISGAQEEASAKTRDLQSVDARLKDESDRLAALQGRNQALIADETRLQSQFDAMRAALADTQNQSAAALKRLEMLERQINAATAELAGLEQQIRDARSAAGRPH